MGVIVFLTSRSFAVILLLVSAALLSVWRGAPGYYSNFYLIVPALLFLSILACVVKRISNKGIKKDTPFFGSFLFHAGMLMVIASASLIPVMLFSATVILPEGTAVSVEDRNFVFVRETPAFTETPLMVMTLNEFKTVYEDDKYPVEHRLNLNVAMMTESGYYSTDAQIGVNAPYERDGYQFMLQNIAYSPLLELTGEKGKVLYRQFLNISNDSPEEALLDISGTDFKVYVRFFPDLIELPGKKYTSRSQIVRNPAIGIRLIDGKNPFKEAWKGVLKEGEEASFGLIRVRFPELKQVVVVQIVKDPTYYGIFAGWIFIVLGLSIRYMRNFKNIFVRAQ